MRREKEVQAGSIGRAERENGWSSLSSEWRLLGVWYVGGWGVERQRDGTVSRGLEGMNEQRALVCVELRRSMVHKRVNES